MSFDWSIIPPVLASQDESMWAGIVGSVAFVMGFGYAIVHAIIRHRERMAKIGMGIDPDESKTGATSSGCGRD